MIQDKTSDYRVTGNLTGSKHAMGIDEAAMAHIMGVLTDLYSDPEAAVIREYSTNAHDAHVEVGNSAPIEVTLPSPLSPFFKVRDYGVGLTEDDIAAIYSRYGASTKRGTNSQVGMLGLGCKSALTYVQQFTVVSVKDGERIQVAITREAEGGSMTVVDRRDSDEPTGTEITIPAKRDGHGGYSSIVDRANEFFAFWPKGSVLVNGKEPERVDGVWLTDSIVVRKAPTIEVQGYNSRHSYRRVVANHRVVMGNVAYPIDPDRINVTVAHEHEAVFFVPIGTVNFVPSREALNYDPKTITALGNLQAIFKREVRNAIQRDVDSAKSPIEAITRLKAARVALADRSKFSAYTYKGKSIPDDYSIPGVKTSYPTNYDDPQYRVLSVPKSSYVQNRCDSYGQFPSELWPEALWVVGYEGKKFSAPQKQKLLKFISERADENVVERFVLVKDDPAGIKTWIDKDRIVKWDDVNAVKLDKAAFTYGSYKKIPGSYDNCIVDGASVSELAAADIDTSKPVFWYGGSWYHLNSYVDILSGRLAKGGYTIVPLPANRKDKFLRNFPSAVELHSFVKSEGEKWVKSLTATQREALKLHDNHAHAAFKSLDGSKIDDPAIKAAIESAKMDLTSVMKVRKMFGTVVGGIGVDTSPWKNPLDKYPLVNAYTLGKPDSVTLKHTILYLNAVYAAA